LINSAGKLQQQCLRLISVGLIGRILGMNTATSVQQCLHLISEEQTVHSNLGRWPDG
jgi:hypothetical protein